MDDSTKLMSPRPLGAGSQIDWYNIREVLGMGGLGITYRAHDGKLDREVAIREYLPTSYAVRHVKYSVEPVSADHEKRYTQGLANFLKVAKTLQHFRHENIIQVHNVIETNNTAYMVMECENGVSLDSIIEQCGTLEQNHQTQIFFPIFKGLQKIHEMGFVHRSIKPTNIRIRENGSPVLLDFGSARQISLHQPMESTALVNQNYMPLEQYSEGYGEQGPCTDIYSLACIMYQGVHGTKPDEALSRSDYILRGQADTVQELQAQEHPTYKQEFLSALHAGLSLQQQDRPQSLSQWQTLFEGDLESYRSQPADNTSESTDNITKPTTSEDTGSTNTDPLHDTILKPVDKRMAAATAAAAVTATGSATGSATDAATGSATDAATDTTTDAATDESFDELDIAIRSTPSEEVAEVLVDDQENEFQSAGIMAIRSDEPKSETKSILLGCLIVAVIAVLVGLLYLKTNDTSFGPGSIAGDSDQSELTDKTAAVTEADPKIEDPETEVAEQSAGTTDGDDTLAIGSATDALAENSSTNSAAETQNPKDTIEAQIAAMPTVFFDKPIPNDPQSDAPRTLAQIAESTSQISPIDGMEDKFWKEKDCSECHNWTRSNLCTLGEFYNSGDDSNITRIQHPFDGYFKLALRKWADDDCG